MKLHINKYNIKSHGPKPPIFYKPKPTISKTLSDKSDSLKVDIKTQSGKANSKTILIYLPMFKTGSTEEILMFLTILQKIIKVQSLTTGPKQYEISKNLLAG